MKKTKSLVGLKKRNKRTNKRTNKSKLSKKKHMRVRRKRTKKRTNLIKGGMFKRPKPEEEEEDQGAMPKAKRQPHVDERKKAIEMIEKIDDFLTYCNFKKLIRKNEKEAPNTYELYLYLIAPITNKRIYFYHTVYSTSDEPIDCVLEEDYIHRQPAPIIFLKEEFATAGSSCTIKSLFIKTTMCLLNGLSLALMMQLYIMLSAFVKDGTNYVTKEDTTSAYLVIGNFNDDLGFFQKEGVALDVEYSLPSELSPELSHESYTHVPLPYVDSLSLGDDEEPLSSGDEEEYSPSSQSDREFSEDEELDEEEPTAEEVESDVQKGHKLTSPGDGGKRAVITYTINHLYDSFDIIIKKSRVRYDTFVGEGNIQLVINHIITVEIPRSRREGQSWTFTFPDEER